MGVWWLFRDTNSCSGRSRRYSVRGNRSTWSHVVYSCLWFLLRKADMLLRWLWRGKSLQLRWERVRLLMLNLVLCRYNSFCIIARRCNWHPFITKGYLFLQHSLYIRVTGCLLKMLTVHSVSKRIHDSNLLKKRNKKYVKCVFLYHILYTVCAGFCVIYFEGLLTRLFLAIPLIKK